MLRETGSALILLGAAVSMLVGGCPNAGRLIPGFNTVEVELVNDTWFPVAPNISFDDDSGFLASLAPSETLSTGLIGPGEFVSYRFDCDELGLILSDEAEQLLPFEIYIAERSRILEREEEYDCGDRIRFRFVGEAENFGVVSSVNGRVVD